MTTGFCGLCIGPGKLEVLLRLHPGLRDAVVLAAGEKGGDRRLLASVVTVRKPVPVAHELRDFLAARL